jgi:hypothetical protein
MDLVYADAIAQQGFFGDFEVLIPAEMLVVKELETF